MSEDINKLKEEIEKLKKENNYLRQYKEALDKTTIISKTDINGIITDANKMFEKISGYKKEELIGQPHNIVRHPDMPKAVFKKMWNTIKKGKIFRGVIKNRKKDGGEYYVLANIIPIKDEKDEIKEFIAIRQDLTKRMQLQKEQENFINNLLEYFLKKLKNPAFSINKYSALIEKELNSPSPDINRIKIYNIHLRKNGLNIQRMVDILKTLIDLKNKKAKIQIEPLNVPKLLSFLFRKYKDIYNKKISFKMPSKEIIINTDKKLFTLLMDILYLNALKFSKEKIGIKIVPKNEKIYIIIETDGEEIKEKIKIFDFFNQLKSNKDLKSGMGMFLVNKIVNLFEYKIKIEGKKVILEISKMPPKKLL